MRIPSLAWSRVDVIRLQGKQFWDGNGRFLPMRRAAIAGSGKGPDCPAADSARGNRARGSAAKLAKLGSREPKYGPLVQG